MLLAANAADAMIVSMVVVVVVPTATAPVKFIVGVDKLTD